MNVAREWRGKGVGTEARRAVATEAFDRLGLVRLVAEVKPDNVASRVVFERAGFALVKERPVTSFVREVGREEGTSARRLEELWRGPFGLEYTDRNAEAGEKRERFWRNLLSEFPVSSVLEVGCNVCFIHQRIFQLLLSHCLNLPTKPEFIELGSCFG